MNDKLINLLPIERRKALSREYLMHLGVVMMLMITVLTLVAGLLLLPTYVFLAQSATANKERLANIEEALYSTDEKELSARLTSLSSDTKLLMGLSNSPSASETIREALSVSRPGVEISGFVYSLATVKEPRTFAISGVAVTRDALRRYQLALQNASFASAASLPVSAYAKDSNISFTITITLKP